MDLTEYRNRNTERQRIADLMSLVPAGRSVLDVGARDGHVSLMLLDRFESVTALDLEPPVITDDRVSCIQGDVTDLKLPSNAFDVVLCAEVLEHIPPERLLRACQELVRVAKSYVVIGVPFRQDIRVGRTTCQSCGNQNPPWGHVNTFDEVRLRGLFSGHSVEAVTFVGVNDEHTNWLSAALMDWAGNPYGTYEQEEPCIVCGEKIRRAGAIRMTDKVFGKLAVWVQRLCEPLYGSHANWIHLRIAKQSASSLVNEAR